MKILSREDYSWVTKTEIDGNDLIFDQVNNRFPFQIYKMPFRHRLRILFTGRIMIVITNANALWYKLKDSIKNEDTPNS